ncbi:MAG TPA: PadR family transcriptional regulator [Gemmataceae bacterium]|jgi:DNA-binding PadR family transcriptional regulator|nr:PadR family transcriptional regulator [Gemmataceae bacterium]
MSQKRGDGCNLWSLTVLCLLRIRPMHPYEIQRLIRDYHKDEFLDLKRGSLYHAIELLRRGNLIDPVETSREGKRPERTVYRLTELGEQEMHNWLAQLLARPLRDMNQFFAALSFLAVLAPAGAVQHLQERLAALDSECAVLGRVLKEMVPRIGRLFLVEVEYARAMRQAERKWVSALIEDLKSGRLQWNPRKLCGPGTEPQELAAPGRLGDRQPLSLGKRRRTNS